MKFNKRKLKRELKRPVDQLRSHLLRPIEFVQKHNHDKSFHEKVKVTHGAQPAAPKVALFLIYQPKKLAESTLVTCELLRRHGYAVMIVSNTQLPPDTKQKLGKLSWQIVERPNFGYDFGGYRDGMRLLREGGYDLEALIVMNDSVWWPVFENDTTITRAEASGHDVSGMILRPKGRKRGRWRVLDKRAPHIQSYFYWFGPRTLQSDAFQSFWPNYPVSSFKYNAIQRGELRLTKHLLDAGLSVASVFVFEDLIAALEKQPPERILTVLRHMHCYTDKNKDIAQRLREASVHDDQWRRDFISLCHELARTSEFHMALHFACIDLLGMNFLKRSAAEPANSPHHSVRANFLKAIEAGDLPQPIPAVMHEIEARHRNGAKVVGR